MPISIKEIFVESLGPLGDRTLQLGKLNLVYGRNETGKTYLVEFLLRSLFRHAKSWPMRDEVGRGKVVLSGLEAGATEFTPDGKRKLEDFWEQSEIGLPDNMARLIVVKGAELALTDSDQLGIDRAVLKAAVSSEALIEEILQGIQTTVRGAKVVDGRIEADQRGEIKTRSDQKANADRMARLGEQVESRYSQGRLRALEMQREQLQAELGKQQDAKRFLAFKTSQELEQQQHKLGEFPRQDLEQLERTIERHKDQQAALDRHREQMQQAAKAAEHYPWITQAADLWESRGLEGVSGPRPTIYAVLAGVLSAGGLGMALALAFLDLIPTARIVLAVSSLVAFSIGTVFWFLYARRLRRLAGAAVDIAQRREIAAEYKRRFGRVPSGLAELKAHKEALREAQSKYEHISGLVDEDDERLQELETTMQRLLSNLGADNVPPESREQVTGKMREWEGTLQGEIHELELRLSSLGVDLSDYRAEPSEISYSADRLGELQRELDGLQQELESAQQDLENLKDEVARETGDELATPWEHLLSDLWQLQRQTEDEYRQTTARILGQIAVTRVLEELKAEEDEKIREGIGAPSVADLLKRVTGTYSSLDFEDGQLLVKSDIATYALSDLSTGAREQVLLAIRMGLASRLAGGEPLFLLLDDAFQHSDWDRRARLVEHVVGLVESGWQVTYLTMDDHLSELFREAGEALGEDYQYYALDS